MAEFAVIVKIRNRMCKGECFECPLSIVNNCYKSECHSLLKEHPEEYERICLDWAKENPEITNADKIYQIVKEAFGEEVAKGIKDFTETEHGCMFTKCPHSKCVECTKNGFWGKPYVEPKEGE